MTELPCRQIHLDFHTSEAIPDVAAEFDAGRFADTLAAAHVNSVTCFARCHHGWLYYETKSDPERVHPNLARPNLLAEQIKACHARGIRVPVYTTVQWDHYTAERHPDWCMITEDGRIRGTPPYEPGFYRYLCVNTPYRQWLQAHVRDLFESLPAVDGLFFDIVQVQECSCRYCREGMLAEGLDPADAGERRRYARDTIAKFKREMTAFIRQYSGEGTIFYNAGHVGTFHRRTADAYTHFELESLPSGGWGYLHFPLTQRYARRLGKDCLGMTGKFHTSWGDFHSFKNPAALEFECFRMLALGAKCSVGDQLHPRGRLCPHTYELIGRVYEAVEAAEPYCRQATPLADIGVLTPEEFAAVRSGSTAQEIQTTTSRSVQGAVRMLEEGRHQFDVLDSRSDFSPYKLIVLPDSIPCDADLAEKLRTYTAAGGALLATWRSGLKPAGNAFALEELGVRYEGEAPYSPDFVVPRGAVGGGLPETEHVMYLPGLKVAADADAEVLVQVYAPYFNRTWRHFCSHQHTPSAAGTGGTASVATRDATYPGIVRNGQCVYFAHPVFAQYAANAPLWCKRLVLNAIDLLLPEPLVRIDGPSTLLAALNEQPDERRLVLHLLHYIPERRGAAFDVIEDVIPLHDLAISIRTKAPVNAVRYVAPAQGGLPAELPFKVANGRVSFMLPRLDGRQIVLIEFAR